MANIDMSFEELKSCSIPQTTMRLSKKHNVSCDGFVFIEEGCKRHEFSIDCAKRIAEKLGCEQNKHGSFRRSAQLMCLKDNFALCITLRNDRELTPNQRRQQEKLRIRQQYSYLWGWRDTPGPHPRPPPGHGRIPGRDKWGK